MPSFLLVSTLMIFLQYFLELATPEELQFLGLTLIVDDILYQPSKLILVDDIFIVFPRPTGENFKVHFTLVEQDIVIDLSSDFCFLSTIAFYFPTSLFWCIHLLWVLLNPAKHHCTWISVCFTHFLLLFFFLVVFTLHLTIAADATF
jgi:hypothetical protein